VAIHDEAVNKIGKIAAYITLSSVFILLVYSLLAYYHNPSASQDLLNRELDSPLRLWLNGRLGIFFNFHFSGPVVWLCIPLGAAWFLKRNYRLVPEYRFMVFFMAAMTLFIAIFAYINYRYVTGFLPLLLLIIIFSLKRSLSIPESKWFLRFLVLLSVANAAYYLGTEMIPKYRNRMVDADNLSQDRLAGKAFWKALNDSCRGSKVLVNNLPEFYLYTDLPSVYAWAGNNVYYNANGEQSIAAHQEPEEFKDRMVRDFQCRYILSSPTLNAYSPAFESFLNHSCSAVLESNNGIILYRLNEY
jgi:hypothetical protein